MTAIDQTWHSNIFFVNYHTSFVKLCFFLHFQKNQLTFWQKSSQHDVSHCLAWSGQQNLTKCWAEILNIFTMCRHMLGRHVIWGVRRHDTTPTFPTKFSRGYDHGSNADGSVFVWDFSVFRVVKRGRFHEKVLRMLSIKKFEVNSTFYWAIAPR